MTYQYFYRLKDSSSFALRKEKCSICNWILFEDANHCYIGNDYTQVCDNCFKVSLNDNRPKKNKI